MTDIDVDSSRSDELPHPLGDHPAWSESYYFNFVDPSTGVGMFTRMGFRAGDGWADGLHGVYLGGDRVAFCYDRRDYAGPDDQTTTVGGLSLTRHEDFKRWTVAYDGPAQDVAYGPVLVTPRKERAEGWYTPAHLQMSVDFEALSPPHYAAHGAQGHFEQTGHVTGRIQISGDTFEVDGYGVRDKSWGPRTWSAGSAKGGKDAETASQQPKHPADGLFTTWFSGNFGPDLAFGGSCFAAAPGVQRGAGWFLRDGKVWDLKDMAVESEYQPDSLLHTACVVTGRLDDGTQVRIEGSTITICPTKIPMPGGATLVNEGLARFTTDGRPGFGIAEYWHAVKRA